MAAEPAAAEPPVFAFHRAEFSVAEQLWVIVALSVFVVMFVLLAIKQALAWEGPPETALVVVWLFNGGMVWFLGHGLLWAWLSMRRGETAGIRVAEGDDYLEVVFFAGAHPCRVQRFAYAEITGCGAGTFFDAFGNPRCYPYVATRGLVGGSSKTIIPLAVLRDARRVSVYQSHAIAVDLDRVIRRHCQLPEPAIPLAVVAEEKEREVLRHAARVIERLGAACAPPPLLAGRYRCGAAATALLCVLWLDGEVHLGWDDGSDWLAVGIVFYGFHKLAGALLKAWRERPRDG